MKAGDKVMVGDPLMVMIAMKMEVRDTPLTHIIITRYTHTHLHTLLLFVFSAAHNPGTEVRRDQEGFLQRGLSSQSARRSGRTGGGRRGRRAGGGEQQINDTQTY